MLISDWSSDVCSSDLPALTPELAFCGDASVEWYFAPSSLLSASGCYRKVKDTLFDSTSIVGDDRYNFNGVDRSGYPYSTTLYGGDGKVYGNELASKPHLHLLTRPLDGFGTHARVSFVYGVLDKS